MSETPQLRKLKLSDKMFVFNLHNDHDKMKLDDQEKDGELALAVSKELNYMKQLNPKVEKMIEMQYNCDFFIDWRIKKTTKDMQLNMLNTP